MSDFIERSVAFGFNMDEFAKLPSHWQSRVLKLLSQVSESSYRRGFQHGAEIECEKIIDPVELRFEWPIQKAPDPHSAKVSTAIDQLWIQYPVLSDLGFEDKEESDD